MKPPRKSQPLSQEYILDSDEGIDAPISTSQPDGVSKMTKSKSSKKPKKVQKTIPQPVSDDSESDDNNAVDSSAPNSRLVSSAPEQTHGSESESSEDSEESEESVETVARKPKKTPKKAPTWKSVPSRPFKPPKGFHPVDNEGVALKSKMCQLISELGPGKQVWHITAPASVPLTELKELSVDALQRGEDLSIGSKSYSTTFTPSSERTLLAATTADGLYRPAKVPISHTLQIREIPMMEVNGVSQRLDEVDPSIFYAQEKLPPRPTPKQPPNLNYRWHPIGTEGSRASVRPRQEMTEEPASGQVGEEPRRKKKKKKRDSERTPKKTRAAIESEQLSSPAFIPDTPSQTVASTESPSKKKRRRKEGEEAME